MYIVKPSNQVAGPKNPVRAGFPSDQEPDICIVNANLPSYYVSMNSKVLAAAIINSPWLLNNFGYELVKINLDEPVDTPSEPPKKFTKKELEILNQAALKLHEADKTKSFAECKQYIYDNYLMYLEPTQEKDSEETPEEVPEKKTQEEA